MLFSYGGKITDLISNIGVPENRIIEIPAGIESHWFTEKISPAPEITRFTFLGRYERRKGVEELNEALNLLLKNNVKFVFNFIGPFNDSEKVISGHITYHGVISDNSQLKDRLDQTDVLVCPSWSEGMPNVIVEAMSRGCAIIATDVGAVSLMVNPDNGLLIEPGNISQLAEALSHFIKMDRHTLDNMKKNSVSSVRKKFVYEMIIDKFISRIESIINKKI